MTIIDGKWFIAISITLLLKSKFRLPLQFQSRIFIFAAWLVGISIGLDPIIDVAIILHLILHNRSLNATQFGFHIVM